MDFDLSGARFREDRRTLPRDCKAALVDVEDRLMDHPTGGGKGFDVSRIAGSVFEYEQRDPHLLIIYEFDEERQRITFRRVRTMAFEDPTVFISYSHKDESWLEIIRARLEQAFAKSKLGFWTDREIAAGAKWDAEIRKKLASALAAVLLVSEFFLKSKYIRRVELPAFLESPQVTLLWLAISRCDPGSDPLGQKILEHQAVINPAEPLEEVSESELKRKLLKLEQSLIAAVLDPLLEGSRGV